MGNSMEKVTEDDEEEDVFDVRKIYWDADGNLRHGTTVRNRDDEVLKLLQADTADEKDMTKLWMIVPSRWVRMWLLFAHFKIESDPPGPIDMLSLLKQDNTVIGGWRPKKNLLAPSNKFGEERPGHYRRITLEAWISLVDLYGLDGFALAVKGFPYDDTTRWRVFKDPKNIDASLLPEPILPDPEEEKKKDKAANPVQADAEGLMKSLGLGSLLGSGGKKDTKKADAAAGATTPVPPAAAVTAPKPSASTASADATS